MYPHLFSRYSLDELYVGNILIFKQQGKKHPDVLVDIPEDKESIEYITILRRQKGDDTVYFQLDNNQPCYYNKHYNENTAHPIVTDLISLKELYNNKYNKHIPYQKKRVLYDYSKRSMN